jgi:Na+-transporting NADH:ubiquinone oxidoreductase subunit F
MIYEIAIAVGLYSVIVLLLVSLIMLAKKTLIPSGDVDICINRQRDVVTSPGGKLLGELAQNGVFLASACGGGGTCAQCLVKIVKGGGYILPTERAHINRGQAREGWRLACQVAVKESMEIEVPAEVFETKKWECTVKSNRNVAAFIKELVLELPQGEELDFKAGGYIQIDVPPYDLSFKEFDIEQEFQPDWEKAGMEKYSAQLDESIVRAYSMANYPGETGIIMLNVRIAMPPAGAPTGTPPGKASSYIFNLKPGDKVTISGPYGEFFIKETDAEMIYIGRGAGMAPLRSHIFELLKGRNSQRKISYYYNARNLRESFYEDEFEQLNRDHDNFNYALTLSRPSAEDRWEGPTGYVHQVLYDSYLKDHPAPEDIEYYLCGPPVMAQSIVSMLDELGVERENIFYDDFG